MMFNLLKNLLDSGYELRIISLSPTTHQYLISLYLDKPNRKYIRATISADNFNEETLTKILENLARTLNKGKEDHG